MACHGPNGRAGEAIPRIETLVYTDTQLMYAAPETLTVRADGTLRYESHTNGFRPAQQDIGVYETIIPEASLRELESALWDPPSPPCLTTPEGSLSTAGSGASS